MDCSYQGLKRNKKNSIVLEKEENIEIQQNSAGFSKSKRTFIRERFFDKLQNRPSTFDNYEGKVLLKNMKIETKEIPNNRKYLSKEKTETWAEHLANNNCRARMQDDSEIAKEKFSLQHQCICISPRYANDKHLKPRPRMRSVGSQMIATEQYSDERAVGDHKSYFKFKLETGPELRRSKEGLKADTKKFIHTIANSDHAVNCYYGIIEQPSCCYCSNNKAINNGSTCHHQNYHRTGPDSNSQYSYRCDEIYYDCANCTCNSKCEECQKNIRSRNQYRRQRTDLNTQEFYCRPVERSSANNESSKRKIKNVTKSKEPNVEGTQHGKRDCKMRKEQSNNRTSSKSREANEKKSLKVEKIYRLLEEDKVSELLNHIDRYIDDHEDELKLEEPKIIQNSNNSSTSIAVKPNREAKLYQDTVSKNRQVSDAITQFAERQGSASQEPIFSMETLKMLKKMKIYEYKPKKPKDKIDDNKQKRQIMNMRKQQEKERNYQLYLEKYSKEIEDGKKIKVLREAPKVVRKLESEKSSEDSKETSGKEALKEKTIKVNRDETNFYYNQNSPPDFESNFGRDTSSFGYVDENIHSSEELSCKHEEAKGSIESCYVESELRKLFHQKFGKIYQEFLEVAKADLQHQQYLLKDHNGCTDDYKELKEKEKRTTQPGMRYDANKITGSARQKQSEESSTEDQYLDKTCKESRSAYSPHDFQSRSSDNSLEVKESINYNPDTQRGTVEQYTIESLRERGLKEINDQHDFKESKDERQKESTIQCGRESEENYDTINDEQIKRSLGSHSETFRETKFKDKTATGKQPSPLQSLREQAEMINFPETHIKQTNAETSKQKEDEDAARNRSQSTILTITADKKENKTAGLMDQLHPLKHKNDNFLIQNSQADDAKEFNEIEQKSQSSIYNDFKQIMDHNLGICIDRSSQTENHIETELNVQVSKQTFTEGVNPEQEISDRHCTLEEALKYLEEFLKSHPHSTKAEQSSYSVIDAAKDLVKKLSSCKTSLTHQVLTSQEDLKEPTQTSGDMSSYSIEKKMTQDTQYKDPESSDLQFQQLTKKEENFSTLAESNESKHQLETKEGSLLSTASHEQKLQSSQSETVDKELATNEFVEQDQTQADLQQRQTSGIYQGYEPHKENLYNLDRLAEINNSQDKHCDTIHKQQRCWEAQLESQHLHKDLSSSSRQPDFDPNLMPSKSILKSSRIMETPQEIYCDLETYKSVSAVSFYVKDKNNVPGRSIMDYGPQQNEIDQEVNENIEGIITKNSVSIQSNQNQPIYSQSQLEPQSVMPHYGAQNNIVEVPAFQQCPCMWETYREMVRNFYKGKEKQLLMQS